MSEEIRRVVIGYEGKVNCITPNCGGTMNKMPSPYRSKILYNCPICKKEFYWDKEKREWQKITVYCSPLGLGLDVNPEIIREQKRPLDIF